MSSLLERIKQLGEERESIMIEARKNQGIIMQWDYDRIMHIDGAIEELKKL